MFYIIFKQIVSFFLNLHTLIWNYSEAGHDKGVPDDVAVTLKRKYDWIVAENKDLSDFDIFWRCVSKKPKAINIVVVNATKDNKFEKEMMNSAI